MKYDRERYHHDPEFRLRHQTAYQKYYKKKAVRLRAAMIAAYGGKCACCGEATEVFLTLEHVGGGGCRSRRSNGGSVQEMSKLERAGWPKEGYTVLCWNCNWAQHRLSACPHKVGKS